MRRGSLCGMPFSMSLDSFPTPDHSKNSGFRIKHVLSPS